ncbi:succinyl-CoA synthetase beta chain (SCS-alpha) [Afipia carboxidovorans OM5]|uniref:Succinyl-CoA ligase [ADP-forming] subunit beta n=1 Tax=Afipia carboxidovorans (strain ATCC 49405 / DSM 1227 / KCTC 32145 / OM5) TaxID=504832 RepID=B6JGP8_AFIC5|nr:ADP-forming succinate--CoA ligase subunit beta [Afipia carboxidovorans]ACI93848.1 succinyl-CoA synthetase beta chain (SCS-alpha) [Afipia carboxidovorans OM5]AEI02475.1 succinyl-CoA ligase [ADP-forming] subunit beta [Afipia carboxidovorans OM4]AEI06051.1 succinyl-CoA ligase [ADP-forming] subunit beta [Afipia carboxidovorans OM5]
MNLEEHAAKHHVLVPTGVPTPEGRVCKTPEEAAAAVTAIGPSVIKAQVPTGKRGKSGGIKIAKTADEAASAARDILSMSIGGHRVSQVLVEQLCPIERELYAAVLIDVASRAPLVLFSTEGGMDIEEVAEKHPDAIRKHVVDIHKGFSAADAAAMLKGLPLGSATEAVGEVLAKLYAIFQDKDAELVEINPLAVLKDGRVVALDCKFVLDDSSALRQPDLAKVATPAKMTELEQRGADNGLKFIQLDGNVGVLANGAGLTMTTMDVIDHFGGRPANFLEIGGEAYTKSEIALDLVLSNPGVKSLVINFCGAFARTDVMAEGVVKAWETLKPKVPVFFSIHGTGEDEAVKLVRERLGIEPYDFMEDAVKAAVEAAQ